MKNVLLATTALIATASVAAAEVKLSGYARFGVGYAEDRSTTNDNIDDTILVSRFRLNIDANAETDAGVKFSARVRLEANEDETNGNAKKAELSGARFSVIYGGLRVDAGNVSGAIDNLADYAGNEPGLEAFISQNAGVDYKILAFSSTEAGSNAAFFQYAVGDLAFGASYDTDPDNGADRWDVSATYTFNNVTAALAYGETEEGDAAGAEDESLAVLTLGAEFGDLSGTLFLADGMLQMTTGMAPLTVSRWLTTSALQPLSPQRTVTARLTMTNSSTVLASSMIWEAAPRCGAVSRIQSAVMKTAESLLTLVHVSTSKLV